VAQSAAWNGAKECVALANATSFATANGTTLSSTSVLAKTLPPLIAYETAEPNGLTQAPQCTSMNTGGADYMQVTVSVQGNMISLFTTALGLYPLPVVGIAN
nr:hypothetical protein [Spirochaetales bacterium]